ncbi:methanogenic corrinoid protein MtbC1 [Agrobacterium vitis]|nr:methanogenic corrinoid protein MtbC1 [Agrobacterium vitis]MBE1439213.1 methanogenic corrinoid protein MtbC1 [Agrobacterium vitis]
MDAVDLSLFGAWPLPVINADAARQVLEVKSADLAGLHDHYADLLNDLTREMRAQFEQFRLLREGADALMRGEDDAAAKLARADLKAASDAMSVIVRTLEKIDALQRQLMRDRELEDERVSGDSETLDTAQARLLALVETQAEAKAQMLFAEWKMQAEAHGGDPPM